MYRLGHASGPKVLLQGKQFGFHLHLAQSREKSAELDDRADALENAHVGEADFLERDVESRKRARKREEESAARAEEEYRYVARKWEGEVGRPKCKCKCTQEEDLDGQRASTET